MYVPGASPPEHVDEHETCVMPLELGQPQNWLGAGLADMPEALLALVTAAVMPAAFQSLLAAYCIPASTA
jgi:hypothetical protein